MDYSNGYEALAEKYLSLRKEHNVGLAFVEEWAREIKPGSEILEIGCGDGVPVSRALIDAGHSLFAIDASATMIQAFSSNFPDVPARQEPVQHSDFFGRKFDCVISIGVMFLLTEEDQLNMISKVGTCLKPGGQFVFTAPTQTGKWNDILTGLESVSLGQDRYTEALAAVDLGVTATSSDAGNNNHYFTTKAR